MSERPSVRAAAPWRQTRSAMGRALDARKPKFYDPARAHEEPPAVTAARERHRALTAEIEQARAAQEARLDALAAAARKARDGDGTP